MKKMMLMAAAVAALSLTGMATAQAGVSLDPSTPQVASATFQQWKSIAEREATAIAAQLGPHSGPWRVQSPDPDRSVFETTFSTMLVTELHNRGVKITEAADAPIIDVRVDAKLLPLERQKYIPGSITVVTAGLWVVHALTSSLSPAIAATTLAVGTDALLSNLPERAEAPVAELAVTLQATQGGDIKARQTNVYLASDLNARDYARNTSATLQFKR